MPEGMVPDLFDGAESPDRETYVLDQGFTRDVTYCKALLPDERMWPAELDVPAGTGGRRRIERRMIFAIAERAAASPDDAWAAAQLHAAIAFWGAPPGQSMVSAVRPFSDPTAPQKLTEALRLARGEGPTSAYKAFSRRSRLWIKNLGPSYFTVGLCTTEHGAGRGNG
jgi:hypothetical protein